MFNISDFHVPCRMLFDEQEQAYGPDLDYCAEERIAYLNPIDICEERHTFRIGEDNDELRGLVGEARDARKKRLKFKFESKYAFYIAKCMNKYQDRKSIVAPYNFG